MKKRGLAVGAAIGRLKGGLRRANELGIGFSREPQRIFFNGMARARQIAAFFSRVLKKRNFGRLDDFFFRRERLPPGGKEYWFIYAASTQGDKKQLVLTFGRSDAKTTVNSRVADAQNVAAVGWLYSGKKKVFLEKSLPLECEKGSLKAGAFSFTGAYPSYELAIGNKTRIRFSKPKKGGAYEAQAASPSTLGVGLLTIHCDAEGTIDGKKFKGTGYVQKVAVVAPFIPWNWARIVFSDRSVLDVFVASLRMRGLNYNVKNTGTYRLASGKTYWLKNASFKRLPGGHWLLEGKGYAAYMKDYAYHPFVLRGRGEFHYDEYMVECEDFAFDGFSKKSGIGLFENAYGFMV